MSYISNGWINFKWFSGSYINNELNTDVYLCLQWLSDRKKRALQKKDVGEFSSRRVLSNTRLVHRHHMQVQGRLLTDWYTEVISKS